jgi:UPF0716 protein FxsA
MFPFLALIFLAVPVIEIYILIQVGQVIGALWTIFFVVLTAVIGVQLLKRQGLSTLSRAQLKMNQGELPAQELIDGIALMMAGAFLLTPGFFTDAFGFLLLIPATRKMMMQSIITRLKASGRFVSVNPGTINPHQSDQPRRSGDVIDGVNYRKEDE